MYGIIRILSAQVSQDVKILYQKYVILMSYIISEKHLTYIWTKIANKCIRNLFAAQEKYKEEVMR